VKFESAITWPIETGGIGEKFFSEYFDGVEIGRQVRKLV
jgi:hypothetical protein